MGMCHHNGSDVSETKPICANTTHPKFNRSIARFVVWIKGGMACESCVRQDTR